MTGKRKYIRILLICLILVGVGIVSSETASAAEGNFNQTATVSITETEDFSHSGQYTWIRYKASKDGYLTITAKASKPSSGAITLYDASQTAPLSGACAYNTASASESVQYYGVKKKGVYFFQVKADGAVSLRCKFKKIKESSGGKKALAKSVKRNKEIKGIVAVGDTDADWYKITVTKKQILHLYYSGRTHATLKFIFSGEFLNTAERYVTRGEEIVKHVYSQERVQPGTYYVQVEGADGASSGYYTLKWN